MPTLRIMHAAFPITDDLGRTGEVIGVWDSDEDAYEAARGKGWYAGDGKVTEVVMAIEGAFGYSATTGLVPLNQNIRALSDSLMSALNTERTAALNTLTPTQRKLLGV
jgi:hypothetical protein